MSIKRKKLQARARRSARVHTSVRAVSSCPRLSIFRSLKHFYAQIIDDTQGQTVVSCSTKDVSGVSGDKKAQARMVGAELAKRALQKGVSRVAFDRGRFLYHGRVEAFAQGAREGGLQI